MIKEFFESLKLKDLVFFVLIIVLFMMVLKKNKKEGFASPYVYTASDFKTKVETALGDNLTAIQNLGDFAGQLISANNKLDLSGVELKVKSLEVKNNSTIKGNSTVQGSSTVQGNCTINNKITVKGGGEFNAVGNKDARYYFSDAEKKGKLRVGAVWGVPGIYSESGNVIIGSKGKEIQFQNNTSRINASAGLTTGGPVIINNSTSTKPALTVNHSCSDPVYLNCSSSNCWIRYNRDHKNTCSNSNSSAQTGKKGAWAGIYNGDYDADTY